VNKNIVLSIVIVGVAILMLTGLATPLLGFLQVWLDASHSVSGLVLVIGALVIAIGTKILWR